MQVLPIHTTQTVNPVNESQLCVHQEFTSERKTGTAMFRLYQLHAPSFPAPLGFTLIPYQSFCAKLR